MSEQHRLTEKGMAVAVEILASDGYLDDMEPSENVLENLVQLKIACNKYVAASVDKGDGRSDDECRNAIVIAYFEAYLTAVTQNVN